MRPAVVAAVLLLVCCQASVTVGTSVCPPKRECSDGWSRLDDQRCAKYFEVLMTASEAELHCNGLGGNLVSIHNANQLQRVLCLSYQPNVSPNVVWIGARNSQGKWGWTDGTPLDFLFYYEGEPNNSRGVEFCVETNFRMWGFWNDVPCEMSKYFVCAKKM